MNATFYTFSKRHNSTKLPTGGSSYSILLKDSCSVSNPVISLKWNGTSDPTAFNMCYIPKFSRYYWIDNWTYSERQWWASCSVDVLASFKTDIGSSSKYVLRAYSDYDIHVPDNKYIPIRPLTIAPWAISGIAWAETFAAGSFVMGVIGQNNTYNVGGVGFVVLSASQIMQVLSACFTKSDEVWSTVQTLGANIGEALARFGENLNKSVQNPLQFINSLVWLPFAANTISTSGTTSLKLGLIDTGITVSCLSDPVHTDIWTAPAPTMNGTDDWMNLEPFVKHILHFPPFPDGEIPGQYILNHAPADITGVIYTDVTTGHGYLIVDSNADVYNASAQIGVKIELAGSMVDVAGQITAAAQTVQSGIGALFNPAGAIAGVTSGIVGFAEASAPRATGGGYSGSVASIKASGGRALYSYYWTVPDLDDEEIGRPLMQIKTISSLSGYVQCSDGELDTSARPEEYVRLQSFLTGGFFYE